eukprot:519096-Amphidinium_carterae.1
MSTCGFSGVKINLSDTISVLYLDCVQAKATSLHTNLRRADERRRSQLHASVLVSDAGRPTDPASKYMYSTNGYGISKRVLSLGGLRLPKVK